MRVGAIASMKHGLEHFVYRELSFFAAQGFAVSLFPAKYGPGLYNPPPEWALHRWHLLPVVLMQPLFFLRAPLRYLILFWEALTSGALADFALAGYFARRMGEVDVIYATFGDRKLFVGYFCKRIVHKPLLVTIHAYELYQNPNPRLFLRALDACDQIVTVTEYNKELLTTQFRVDPERIAVVRLSVDTADYRPQQKFVVLIVGFFVDRKGHDVLFQAVKQLGHDDLEVWIVGGPGAEQAVDVRAQAVALGVESQVAFFGTLSGNALKAVYRACDVFCLPCRKDNEGVSEGFPAAIIEAMACGKPVISTRHVEIPRILKEIVVDENDVAGLAEALEQVYRSAALRARLGTENRKIAETVFSLENAGQTAAILRRLARQQPDTRPHADRLAQDAEALGG